MKNYNKPQIEIKNIVSTENISNLSDWLNQNQVDSNVQITTFTFVS